MNGDSALSRYLDLAAAFDEQRSWFESASIHQYAALLVIDTPGDPRAVARDCAARADELRRASGWFDTLRSSIRHPLGALLVRQRLDPERFCVEVDRARRALRALHLRRSSGTEVSAALIMRIALGFAPTEREYRRLRDVYDRMKERHGWFTGTDDYPACALFAVVDEPIPRSMRRVEAIYDRLVAAGIGRSNATQLTSHLLHFAAGDDTAVTDRFLALRDRFQSEGVSIWRADHDELALLANVNAPVLRIVETVLRHRGALRDLRPRPGAVLSFSLAANTAARELAGGTAEPIQTLQILLQVHELLRQHQQSSGASVAAMH